MNIPLVSLIIVSFNTRDLLQRCLQALQPQLTSISHEIFVVDNDSKDGSADMVEQTFPDIKLIRSGSNLGFAAANNLAFQQVKGKYIILFNPDAFLKPQALEKAVNYMDTHPEVGLMGGRLINEDGSWQPSARLYPSLLNHFLAISGLAHKYAHSRFFGRFDRTWADHNQIAEVDWIPGAFVMMPQKILSEIGYFDERFFLYYEEVDLCWRIQKAGYKIMYIPDVIIVHIGGVSSKTLNLEMSDSGAQISLWQMRSALLFYYKHYGIFSAWLWMQLENNWHRLRIWKNYLASKDDNIQKKINYSKNWRKLIKQAWQDTKGGKISPPRPW